MRRRLGLLTLTLALTACGGGSSDDGDNKSDAATPLQVVGVVQAHVNMLALWNVDLGPNETYVHGETPCKANHDRSAGVTAGAQVTVKDAEGRTVGTGRLSKGVLGGAEDQAPVDSPCEFGFEVADVPGGSDFYEVAVSGLESVTFPADELSEPVTISAK